MVTRHRIKPGRKGGKYIPGNVIGLCPNHHALAEQGYFTQYELFQIVQLRIRLEQMEKQGVRLDDENMFSMPAHAGLDSF
jgi:hypothetical protein